ncbi:Nucleoid-associated protein [Saliniradius amylolyticus]|uniref:Nucleoid-associated protein n=1 Tax=Saliniradius amylolyticus TaxID=2183582 RepID=A0A2S2E348_9ALTE|nr:nucleoid-associated protein YejK [Saliniradius amylolyticus]AWL12068.1 Nucleoid-associated protein [Saliniradius amylolyticus]
MSAIINHFVVHRLQSDEQQTLALKPRHELLSVTPQIESLAQQIHATYTAKPGKGVGGLGDAEHPKFAELLDEWISEQRDFLSFSIEAGELFRNTLLDFDTIETGFVIFSHYQYLATDYLTIALLNTKQHVEVNQELELTYSDHLDLSKMQLAARIDLTDYRVAKENQRYVSFIKGRAGRKVADFFLAFLGCEEEVDTKQQNKQLVASVDEYLSVEQLAPEEKQQSRQQVAEYYKEKLEAGEDIAVKDLSERLARPDSERDFYSFVQQDEQPVEESFQADRSVLKGLAKFSGQGKGVSISFDRSLLGNRVTYDAATDTLIIKEIPPNLKDQLSREG